MLIQFKAALTENEKIRLLFSTNPLRDLYFIFIFIVPSVLGKAGQTTRIFPPITMFCETGLGVLPTWLSNWNTFRRISWQNPATLPKKCSKGKLVAVRTERNAKKQYSVGWYPNWNLSFERNPPHNFDGKLSRLPFMAPVYTSQYWTWVDPNVL